MRKKILQNSWMSRVDKNPSFELVLEKQFYPLLDSEGEFQNLIQKLTDLNTVDVDVGEIRALTGLYRIFPDSVDPLNLYEVSDDKPTKPKAVKHLFGSICEYEYRGSEYNFVYEFPGKISFYTNYSHLKKKIKENFSQFGIEFGVEYSGIKTQFLLSRLMAPYLPDIPSENFFLKKLGSFYSLDKERIVSIKGKLVAVDSVDPYVKLKCESYYHPFLSNIIVCEIGRELTMSVRFHQMTDGRKWLEKANVATSGPFGRSDLKKIWSLIKDENLLVLPHNMLAKVSFLNKQIQD